MYPSTAGCTYPSAHLAGHNHALGHLAKKPSLAVFAFAGRLAFEFILFYHVALG
jgi:hypothetical protein